MEGYKPTHVSKVSRPADGNCLKEPGYYAGMEDLYVVEIAATGTKGAPSDAVAEVAVCLLPGSGSEFETVFYNMKAGVLDSSRTRKKMGKIKRSRPNEFSNTARKRFSQRIF